MRDRRVFKVVSKRNSDPVTPTQKALRDALAGQETDIAIPKSADGWGMAADTLGFLARLVPRLKPRHILEFGAGLSTQLLARAGAKLEPGCRLSSVDHDPEFGGIAAAKLKETSEPICRMRFQVAPLVSRDCGGKYLPVYHVQPSRLASRRPADMVVIDGPPTMLGGREGMLYQAMGYCRPGSVILLDDANRAEEQRAIARWKELLQDDAIFEMIPGIFKGLLSVVVRRQVSPPELWQRRMGLAAAELEGAVGSDAKVLLVGDDWWRDAFRDRLNPAPFPARDGQYWGPPENDDSAVRELENARAAGADYLAIGWPDAWWLDFYAGFRHTLRSRFRCVLESDRLVVFDLRQKPVL
jgi:predicted O-methyltransferase YrrM